MPFPELFRDDVFRIETPRLWLRWPRSSDAAALQRIVSRADAAPGHSAEPPTTVDLDWEILHARQANAEGKALVVAMTRKKGPGEIVGWLGLRDTGERNAELWFQLDPPASGRGLATEAVGAVASAAFNYSRFNRITAAIPFGETPYAVELLESGFERNAAPELALTRATWSTRISLARAARHGFGVPATDDTIRAA